MVRGPQGGGLKSLQTLNFGSKQGPQLPSGFEIWRMLDHPLMKCSLVPSLMLKGVQTLEPIFLVISKANSPSIVGSNSTASYRSGIQRDLMVLAVMICLPAFCWIQISAAGLLAME